TRPQPRRPPLSPYTTLFRSEHLARDPPPGQAGDRRLGAGPGRFRVPAEEPGGQEARTLGLCFPGVAAREARLTGTDGLGERALRSEEHTSELQSRGQPVCRL